VQLRSCCFGALAALALALALSGCASSDLDLTHGWFQKPLDFSGRTSGYTFSELQESRKERTITAADLVNSDGACPPPPVPAAAPPAAGAPGAGPAAAPEAPSLVGEGVALGMSECDVVYRAGAPASVQLGQNPNGDRTAVLTFNSGPRPGIYRFEGGRLTNMDRVAEPTPPQVVKKKPTKPSKPAKPNDAA